MFPKGGVLAGWVVLAGGVEEEEEEETAVAAVVDVGTMMGVITFRTFCCSGDWLVAVFDVVVVVAVGAAAVLAVEDAPAAIVVAVAIGVVLGDDTCVGRGGLDVVDVADVVDTGFVVVGDAVVASFGAVWVCCCCCVAIRW